MTDSSFVLQVLNDIIKPTIYASDLNELHSLWSQLHGSVIAAHVKGHAGHALNTIADLAAKQALYLPHNRITYRTADYTKAHILHPNAPAPPFPTWL